MYTWHEEGRYRTLKFALVSSSVACRAECPDIPSSFYDFITWYVPIYIFFVTAGLHKPRSHVRPCEYILYGLFVFGATAPPSGPGPSSFTRSLYHTQRRITVGRTPQDEWSAHRRDYLTTHNTHNGQISMPTVGFEPTISAGERPQTYANSVRGI